MITAREMYELAGTCPTLGYGLLTVLKEIEFAAKLGRYQVILPYPLGSGDYRKLEDQGFYVSPERTKTYISWGKE